MSDFLQQVSSFLNLNKLVAVTLPGIIATLALMLFFVPRPCPKAPCWYCMDVSNKEEVPRPKAGTAARPQGTYWVSKLSWEQANQSYKTLEEISQTNLTVCAQLPEYVISSSRLKTEKETAKNLGDLVPVDPAALLENLDSCSSALTAAQTELNIKEAAQSSVIATLNESLKKLSTSLADATAALNSALERSLTAQVNEVRTRLEKQTTLDSDLKSAANATGNLLTQVSDSRKAITSDVSAAIPVETPTTWPAAMQALGSHILIFLLVSIMVGQLLDPIQRMAVSWDPIRGLAFPLLNKIHRAIEPIGGVRFGDQRYPGTRSPDIRSLLERDPHLLEPDYAIGRGLLTQAEYGSLQDDYYRESQISTGLIVPSFMLALAIYIRLLCCGAVKVDHGEVWICALLILTLWFLVLALLVWHHLEPEERKDQEEKAKREEERKRVEEQLQRGGLPDGEREGLEGKRKGLEEKLKPLPKGERRRLRKERKQRSAVLLFVLILPALAIVVGAFVAVSYAFLRNWPLVGLAVGLPTLEVLCLTVGMDRLHNFYSQVQARIVGAAKKQEDSQVKKFADIVTDQKAKQSFIDELGKRDKEINQILGPLTGGVSQIEKAVDLLTDPTLNEAFKKELEKRRKAIEDILGHLQGGKP